MTKLGRRGRVLLRWGAIKHAYERTNLPVTRIAQDYAVSEAALHNEIKRDDWKRRHPPQRPPRLPGRKAKMLAARLAHIAESEIAVCERQQQKRPRAGNEENRHRLAELAALARLVERIATLEGRETDAESATANEPRVIDDARRLEIARRLEGIRRQLEFERTGQAAEAT